jgi:hypothetical protein
MLEYTTKITLLGKRLANRFRNDFQPHVASTAPHFLAGKPHARYAKGRQSDVFQDITPNQIGLTLEAAGIHEESGSE